jgi:hypothetical protein
MEQHTPQPDIITGCLLRIALGLLTLLVLVILGLGVVLGIVLAAGF